VSESKITDQNPCEVSFVVDEGFRCLGVTRAFSFVVNEGCRCLVVARAFSLVVNEGCRCLVVARAFSLVVNEGSRLPPVVGGLYKNPNLYVNEVQIMAVRSRV
jgi:hypothetical protein